VANRTVSRLHACCCQVFYGISFKPGDVILTSVAEYGSNYLAYLQVRQAAQAGMLMRHEV
jgi:selenocysteine lyase/cysteine desulfurase